MVDDRPLSLYSIGARGLTVEEFMGFARDLGASTVHVRIGVRGFPDREVYNALAEPRADWPPLTMVCDSNLVFSAVRPFPFERLSVVRELAHAIGAKWTRILLEATPAELAENYASLPTGDGVIFEPHSKAWAAEDVSSTFALLGAPVLIDSHVYGQADLSRLRPAPDACPVWHVHADDHTAIADLLRFKAAFWRDSVEGVELGLEWIGSDRSSDALARIFGNVRGGVAES